MAIGLFRELTWTSLNRLGVDISTTPPSTRHSNRVKRCLRTQVLSLLRISETISSTDWMNDPRQYSVDVTTFSCSHVATGTVPPAKKYRTKV